MIETLITSFMLGTTNPNPPKKDFDKPKEYAVVVENDTRTKTGKQIRARMGV